MITVVSFYADAPGTNTYKKAAERLMHQCDKLQVPHHIVHRSFGNDWISNVRAKPRFLLDTARELQRPFLWLDADSCLLKRPLFADRRADSVDWAATRKAGKLRVWDCVHLIGNSKRTIAFLKQWVRACAAAPRGGSHSAVGRIWPRLVDTGLVFCYLPTDYVRGPVSRIGLAKVKSKREYMRKGR